MNIVIGLVTGYIGFGLAWSQYCRDKFHKMTVDEMLQSLRKPTIATIVLNRLFRPIFYGRFYLEELFFVEKIFDDEEE